MTPSRPRGVLFLCVANSARSQMAEGFARRHAPSGTPIFSAGSAPSSLNPYAVRVMQEVGIDLSSQRSKGIDELPADALDEIGTAVTLCAEEVCPVFSRDVEKLHWPHPDPAAAGGSEDEILQSFRAVRDRIGEAVQTFFSAARNPRRGDS